MLRALSFDYNFGASMVLSLFAWILISGAIIGFALAASERGRAIALLGFLESNNYDPLTSCISRWLARRVFSGIRADLDASTAVRHAAAKSNRIFVVCAVVLSALSGYAVYRDVNAHSVFTREAYIRTPFFPWGQHAPRPWTDAVAVRVGCNHVIGRRAGDIAVYEVVFADGASVRLVGAVPLAGPWLETIEVIDARLREANVPFERWRVIHQACLSAYTADMTQERAARFNRLLRVGGL